MTKLTIKELAPYLPYNLKVMVTEDWSLRPGYIGYPEHKQGTILTFSHYTIMLMQQEKNPLPFKPIFRPLSDWSKEIKHNGETFNPYEYLKNVVSEEQWIRICNTIIPPYKNISDLPFWYVQMLISWHFDVYGLIDENKAIDKNTLK